MGGLEVLLSSVEPLGFRFHDGRVASGIAAVREAARRERNGHQQGAVRPRLSVERRTVGADPVDVAFDGPCNFSDWQSLPSLRHRVRRHVARYLESRWFRPNRFVLIGVGVKICKPDGRKREPAVRAGDERIGEGLGAAHRIATPVDVGTHRRLVDLEVGRRIDCWGRHGGEVSGALEACRERDGVAHLHAVGVDRRAEGELAHGAVKRRGRVRGEGLRHHGQRFGRQRDGFVGRAGRLAHVRPGLCLRLDAERVHV